MGIDRVLAGADAAKASLYQRFGCEDQLVASYLERRTVDARANIEAYLADTPSEVDGPQRASDARWDGQEVVGRLNARRFARG